jgi:glycosyltransferase involved in cell wall biosynthesis
LTRPKVTFGIIVLNGEPFTRYCLRALYPYAHEIIVVEGGHEDAGAAMTPDGHSVDGTLETLRAFKRTEDPEGKLTIVTRDGPWPKLDEMGRCRTPQSREYAERATGDYLWQVDIDEFYTPDAIERVLELLRERPEVTAISFLQRTFWGSLNCWADSWALRQGASEYHRLFKWGPGYRYLTHEPPTVLDESGKDLRARVWLRGRQLQRMGIELYHYSLLFPSQVRQKCAVYHDERPEYAGILEWASTGYERILRPYRVHNLYRSPSWLRRFNGVHPPAAVQMVRDIENGVVDETLRDMSDVESLLRSPAYALGRVCLSAGDYADRLVRHVRTAGGRLRRQALGLTALRGGAIHSNDDAHE